MKYIKFGVYTGEENMRIDSELLEEAIQTQIQEPIFRLYAWSPKCVSLGRNQGVNALSQQSNSSCKEIIETCAKSSINVVRRVTGGRALLHDNEITYSYITPISAITEGESVSKSYKYISGILINFFKTLGVELTLGDNKHVSTKHDYCMLISTGADVCYHGKKIIGSAQFRKSGYILQHGSILFDYDKTLLEKLFNETVDTDCITTVNEILPDMTKEKFISAFEEYLTRH